MNAGKTLFAQLMDCLPWSTFARIVARYHGDHSVQTFPCTEQYRAMAFAQLTYRESLRDIEACHCGLVPKGEMPVAVAVIPPGDRSGYHPYLAWP
jgi:hypothetical protein